MKKASSSTTSPQQSPRSSKTRQNRQNPTSSTATTDRCTPTPTQYFRLDRQADRWLSGREEEEEVGAAVIRGDLIVKARVVDLERKQAEDLAVEAVAVDRVPQQVQVRRAEALEDGLRGLWQRALEAREAAQEQEAGNNQLKPLMIMLESFIKLTSSII